MRTVRRYKGSGQGSWRHTDMRRSGAVPGETGTSTLGSTRGRRRSVGRSFRFSWAILLGRLGEANVSANVIMTRTGHKSLSSVQCYVKTRLRRRPRGHRGTVQPPPA